MQTFTPLIGIAPKLDDKNSMMHVPVEYVRSIVAAGATPLILPLTWDMNAYERLLPSCDGFLLCGGLDIEPQRYGRGDTHVNLTAHTPGRDALECLVVNYAYEFDVPILGICRGMQMLNVVRGGTLHLDLSERASSEEEHIAHDAIEHPFDYVHDVDVVPGTMFAEIVEEERIPVNSLHHQGVNSLGRNMRASAYATDGLVEAIEAIDRTFMMGVQWHPENLVTDGRMLNLFDTLARHSFEARNSGRLEAAQGLSIELTHKSGAWPDITLTRAD
ncbi:Gamma-glutamyl-gamma-aminobutyrate hydrolase PuuD [Slackia heliotrinireducens]|uniref:Predicted glutamine amidotransferase n=1 Tax=Slackia heliotrinireducens (strain ATCC 29202 / DSM 20476 / NCTC 11029 / RHS 1) TaxID=471855 RepID=C7N7Q4_SLAHD|nr:gamma-glutamyl-gamma-aminobutyrate hydrolase family protein [Slackia heliotrinireducens]ACV22939.1 predicted glutamine amidotransferase [Slackia heliotrinireducens DSM 20476]VEH01772.1 Gamma-glutamyl-gamma-aminobutyrate hydrolase PuuD [Slackia heliotrinireducens]